MLSQGWKTEGVPLRDGELHKRRAARVYNLQHSDTPKRKVDDYLKRYGCRWSELCRLPYFDPVTMGVLDPMHMLLQGLTKTLWFHTWVQGGKEKIKLLREGTEAGTRRELDEIHEVLQTFEMPTSYARLPTKVGYPAGGSLTSDEWRALAVVYGPAEASQKQPKPKSQGALTQPDEDINLQGNAPHPERLRADPEAAQNYLKFATVLKVYMRREISERDIERASRVYLDFFEEYVKVRSCVRPQHITDDVMCCRTIHPTPTHHLLQIYGVSNVTPTFHWVTHMPAQIRRYGPVHSFWTFLFERLNKVLKAINTSGHKGGVVEVTFAREFKHEI
ncbi:hypothetical protein CALCODRAFT_533217, partial [Calocera cornea HHB12733]